MHHVHLDCKNVNVNMMTEHDCASCNCCWDCRHHDMWHCCLYSAPAQGRI